MVKVKAATLTRSDGEKVRSARTREAEAVDLRREEKAICWAKAHCFELSPRKNPNNKVWVVVAVERRHQPEMKRNVSLKCKRK